MKRVFGSFNLQIVYHKKNLLEAEGIAATVRNEILSSAMGELPPAEFELWVSERDLSRALEVIRENRQSGPDWACTRCAEVSEGQFSHCWNCGAPRTPAPR